MYKCIWKMYGCPNPKGMKKLHNYGLLLKEMFVQWVFINKVLRNFYGRLLLLQNSVYIYM